MITRSTSAVVNDVLAEIDRQIFLQGLGRFERTPDQMTPSEFFVVLTEEIGEVARAIQEAELLKRPVDEISPFDYENYYTEIVQVAAICVAHLMSIPRA